MRALSIRQPYVELILRGQKTIEYRSKPTRIIGERFYIYASRNFAAPEIVKPAKAWSTDLAMPASPLPQRMLDLADTLILNTLPRGLIVGTAVISKVTRGESFYEWHLADVERLAAHRKPVGHPQPVWFNPFN